MNKFLKITRYLLLTSLVVFVGLFVHRFNIKVKPSVSDIEISPKVILMFALLFIYVLLSIKDIFMKIKGK